MELAERMHAEPSTTFTLPWYPYFLSATFLLPPKTEEPVDVKAAVQEKAMHKGSSLIETKSGQSW